MGEKVQLGGLTYQVLETDWRTELGPGGRAPNDRYLFVRVSVVNAAGERLPIPAMTIEGSGKTYTEVTDGMEKVENWLGLIRNIDAGGTDHGWIVFDAPVAAYKLVVTEPGEVGQEKYARVDIPLQLE